MHYSFDMRCGVKFSLILALAMNLVACSEKKPGGSPTVLPKEDGVAAEIERFQAAENARSRITLIDAASGAAAAMPGEWSGPTAYNLRGKEDGTKAKAKPDHRADAARPPTWEVFPSVAE